MIAKITAFLTNRLSKLWFQVAPPKWSAWLIIREIRAQRLRQSGPAILALNPDRFRNDLEILQSRGFTVLRLPFEWQARLYTWFYPPEFDAFSDDPKRRDAQTAFRIFLRPVLREIIRYFDIKIVISAAVHYPSDYDWGVTAKNLGVPYFVFHRENLVTAPGHREAYFKRMKGFPKFEGSEIVVHNETVRKIFIDTGYVAPEHIHALGSMRMDAYLDYLKQPVEVKKQLVFFGFGPGTGLIGRSHAWPREGEPGMWLFCRNVHRAIADFAIKHPDIHVVIKPKWGGRWLSDMKKFWSGHCEVEKITNLQIDAELDAQTLIRESEVVVAYGSTTLLEAAIAGKPVILPIFNEAQEAPFRPFVSFFEHQELFTVADSPDNFLDAIERAFSDSSVDETVIVKRQQAFSDYVSDIRGGAVERYLKLLAEHT